MRIAPSLILVPALALTGCASQQTLDAQAGMADAQRALAARVAKLEADQAALASRLVEGDAALKRELDAARSEASITREAVRALATRADAQASATKAGLAALDDKFDAHAAALRQVQAAADDAIKIARDSRLVSGKVIEKLVLNEDMVLFNYEAPELTASGRAALDQLVAGARPQLPHVFIEIIGFTDNLSLGSQNARIALARAEAVRRYLHEVGGMPLNRMSSISYGDLLPVSTEPSFESRRLNRRVIVQVLK